MAIFCWIKRNLILFYWSIAINYGAFSKIALQTRFYNLPSHELKSPKTYFKSKRFSYSHSFQFTDRVSTLSLHRFLNTFSPTLPNPFFHIIIGKFFTSNFLYFYINIYSFQFDILHYSCIYIFFQIIVF